jgi:hypothetical protein
VVKDTSGAVLPGVTVEASSLLLAYSLLASDQLPVTKMIAGMIDPQ